MHVSGDMVVTSNLEVGVSNLFVDTTNSRIGIGTVDPSNLLHVYKANNDETSGILIEKASGQIPTSAALFFGVASTTETNNRGIPKAAIFYERNLVNGRGDLKFCNDEIDDTNPVSTAASDTRMIIKNNGDVGIGTVSPGAKLQVGDGIVTSPAGTRDADGSISVYGAGRKKVDQSKPGIYHRENVGLGLHSDYKMSFEVNGSSSVLDAMTIDQTGNVGIGRTSPSTALDVNGVIKSTVPSWGVHQLATMTGLLRMTNYHATTQNCTVTLSTGSPARTRVTATVAGRYFVSFMAFSEYTVPAGTAVQISLLKNGSTHARNYAIQPITNYSANGGIAVVVDLAVDDYLEIQSNSDLHGNANGYFSGFLIG
jgi:hypothetical protein